MDSLIVGSRFDKTDLRHNQAGVQTVNKLKSKVFLIGGAPGAGKTTLGTALAIRLGVTSLTIDDLVTAAIAITSPETHPGLHALRKMPHLEYFTHSAVDQLKADATLRHEATWPMIEAVIRKYTRRGSGIVIDGWHIRPNWVAQLNMENVWSGWIVVSPAVLEARERQNESWFQGSPDPQQMFENFLARSLWYNDLIKKQATELQMNILPQDGQTSVDELCELVLAKASG
jgi:2-phosphoglycerate kinase